MHKLLRQLFDQVDASSLAVFRIGFGALLVFDSINQFFLCLPCKYLQPSFLFKYRFFEWIEPWPGIGLYVHWSVLTIAAIAVMLGYHYRLALFIFTVGFSYAFLLDEALYLNHYYMVILFCIIMLFLPANTYWSLDARRKASLASNTIPRWAIVVLIIQLEIILLYAGLVKLNPDWLNLQPLRMWMIEARPNFPPFFTTLTSDIGITIGAYGAIALHLVGAPLLLFRKTRLWVLGVYCLFHTMNHYVFNIGIFPWFTLFASTLFLDPDWPKKLAGRFVKTPHATVETIAFQQSFSLKHLVVLLLMCSWLMLQITVPLRHWTLPGNVAWNEDGHRFSWRMKLRSKRGSAVFTVKTADKQWQVNPARYLTRKQHRKMVCIPDMLLQFSHFLEEEWKRQGRVATSVTVNARCALNSRPHQLMVDPTRNLLDVDPDQLASEWILPLTTVLPARNSVIQDRSTLLQFFRLQNVGALRADHSEHPPLRAPYPVTTAANKKGLVDC